MAEKNGRTTISGTGSKTIATALTGAPTWCELSTASGTNVSLGWCDGSAQDYLSTGPTEVSGNTKIASLQDSSGTIVFEATWTSFGTSGSNGTVVLNVTTNPSTRPCILKVGN